MLSWLGKVFLLCKWIVWWNLKLDTCNVGWRDVITLQVPSWFIGEDNGRWVYESQHSRYYIEECHPYKDDSSSFDCSRLTIHSRKTCEWLEISKLSSS